MKKECSAEEGRVKAEAYCALSEHCRQEVLAKLQQWGVPAEAWELIVAHLEEKGFLNERRYAAFYVRDKYRFNQWGKIKIGHALRMKQVPSACIDVAMEEIDEEEYMSILLSLLKKKVRTVKASNDYERNGKLIRFAAGHGYELDAILSCLRRMGCGDEYME